jgi:hypothetical protein
MAPMKLIGDRWPAALFGLLVVAPWNLLVAFGVTFTFREHESVMAWMFVWVTFLLTAPASILALTWPRIGGAWVVGNLVISVAMASAFELKSAAAPDASPFQADMLPGLLLWAAVFWLPNIFLALGLLWPRRTRAGAKAQA